MTNKPNYNRIKDIRIDRWGRAWRISILTKDKVIKQSDTLRTENIPFAILAMFHQIAYYENYGEDGKVI